MDESRVGMGLARAMWLTLTLTLVAGRGWCACYDENHMRMCPYPFFARAHNNEAFTVTCSWGNLGFLYLLKMGISVSSGHYVVKLIKGEAGVQIPRLSYMHLKSLAVFTETNTSLTMVIYSPSMWNLITRWYCSLQYRTARGSEIRYNYNSKKVELIAHPGNPTFTRRPAKSSYNYSEMVGLRCNATSALTVSAAKRLNYTFQFFYQDRWITIDSHNTFHSYGIVGDAASRTDHFIYRTYTLHLRVASISGCSRLYRCILSYEDVVFEEQAVELLVNVSVCSGTCLPSTDNITCPTPPRPPDQGRGTGRRHKRPRFRMTPSPDSLEQNISDIYEDYEDSEDAGFEQQASFVEINKGLLMGAISSTSFLAMALLALLAIILLRRRRKRQREMMEGHRLPIQTLVGQGEQQGSHHMLGKPTPTRTYSWGATTRGAREPGPAFDVSVSGPEQSDFTSSTFPTSTVDPDTSTSVSDFAETSVDMQGRPQFGPSSIMPFSE